MVLRQILSLKTAVLISEQISEDLPDFLDRGHKEEKHPLNPNDISHRPLESKLWKQTVYDIPQCTRHKGGPPSQLIRCKIIVKKNIFSCPRPLPKDWHLIFSH